MNPLTTELDKIVEWAAEKTHEHFESVRHDVLRVPDSDITESIIRSAIVEALKGAGVVEALKETAKIDNARHPKDNP